MLGLLLLVASAAGPEAVIPEGWSLSRRVDGDLNGDKVPDALLVVNSNEAQVFIIAFRSGETWVKHGEEPFSIPRGGGAFCGAGGCDGVADLDGDRIVTTYEYGSREVGEVNCAFRYDAQRKRFRLVRISEDVHDRVGEDPDTHRSLDFGTSELTESVGSRTFVETVVVRDAFLGDVDACAWPGDGHEEASKLVPASWTVESFSRGDLDGDASREGVLMVKKEGACGFVVLKKKSGSYERSDAITRYPCDRRLAVSDGFVVLKSNTAECKFRLDKKSGGFVIIGREAESSSEKVSTNFLTRKRVVSRLRPNGKWQTRTEKVDRSNEELSERSDCVEPQ